MTTLLTILPETKDFKTKWTYTKMKTLLKIWVRKNWKEQQNKTKNLKAKQEETLLK